MGTELLANGFTIDPDEQQEFVIELGSGTILRGNVFAAVLHYGSYPATPTYQFHSDTRVYIRAAADAAAGTMPVIQGSGGRGGASSYNGAAKDVHFSGGGGGGSGQVAGPGGDTCIAASQGGSFEGADGTASTGGAGASGSSGGATGTSCDGTAGLSGGDAILALSLDATRPGNLWFDIDASVNGGVAIRGGGGGGGGGNTHDPALGATTPGAGGTGGGPGLNGLPGDLGSATANAGLGYAGGSAGSALYVVMSSASYGFVGSSFGPSFLGRNTSGAGAVREA